MAKISVIDDSKATLDMISDILQKGGHGVTSFSDPNAVEEKLAENKPDLVLLDVVMPERNGYEILRALKRNPETKSIPVILVSSKAEETDIRWGLRQGAVDYVTKPFTPQQLMQAVGSQL